MLGKEGGYVCFVYAFYFIVRFLGVRRYVYSFY